MVEERTRLQRKCGSPSRGSTNPAGPGTLMLAYYQARLDLAGQWIADVAARTYSDPQPGENTAFEYGLVDILLDNLRARRDLTDRLTSEVVALCASESGKPDNPRFDLSSIVTALAPCQARLDLVDRMMADMITWLRTPEGPAPVSRDNALTDRSCRDGKSGIGKRTGARSFTRTRRA